MSGARPGAGGGAVVQVTLWSGPYQGNFLASQLALARAVHERFGLGTHLVLAPGGGDEPWIADVEAAGATWSELPLGDKRAARAHLDGVVREHGGRLVHTHFTAADLTGAAAARAAGIPCLWHIHTGFTGYPAAQRIKDLYKIRVVERRAVARVLVVSPWLRTLMLRRGVAGQDVVVVPNRLVLDRFATVPDRAQARRRLGLAEDAFVAVAFGWWPEIKGVDVVLDALARIGDASRVTGLVVGEDATRAAIAAHAGPGRPIPGWVRQSGFVTDPAWVYAAGDVFVSASRHEGQSYSIGEAMACGLPVVMSDIPGTAGWGEAPEVTTFASGDGAALAGALEAVAARPPEERRAAGAANRAWIFDHWGVDRWCEQVGDVYAPLLSSN